MKRTRNLLVIIAIVLCMVLGMTACGSEPVAAKVGNRSVSVMNLKNAYNNSLSYASYYGYETETAEGRQDYLEYILDSLVEEQVIAYEAEQAGVTLTDEEKAEAEKKGQENYDSYYQQFVDYYSQSNVSDVNAYANKTFAESLADSGMTVSKLKEQYRKNAIDDKIIEKYQAQLQAEYTPTAEELKEMYKDQLDQQKSAMESLPSYYFTLETYYQYGYSYMPLFVPEGLFYVKHILVEDEATANDIKAKLDAGEDFDTLMKEFNTDTAEDNYPDGYICGEGASFVEEFLNAALALEKEGDISDIVKSEYGFHIIRRGANVESHEISYEEVKADFDEMATSSYQSEKYSEKIAEFKEKDVTKYPENYQSIAQ